MIWKLCFGQKHMVVAEIMHGGIMETSEKTKIFFTVATVHVPRYGELIASEKRALPRLQKELNEANQLKMESHRTMMSRHRKRK